MVDPDLQIKGGGGGGGGGGVGGGPSLDPSLVIAWIELKSMKVKRLVFMYM